MYDRGAPCKEREVRPPLSTNEWAVDKHATTPRRHYNSLIRIPPLLSPASSPLHLQKLSSLLFCSSLALSRPLGDPNQSSSVTKREASCLALVDSFTKVDGM